MKYVENEIIGLKKGEKYTVIQVSECSAMTRRIELIFESQKVIKYAQYPKVLIIIFKLPRKRKLYEIKVSENTALFKGWNIPLILDTEQLGNCTMRGNALINVIINDEKDKETAINIFQKNINPDFNCGLVIAIDNSKKDMPEAPLFLEQAKEAQHTHAPLNNIIRDLER